MKNIPYILPKIFLSIFMLNISACSILGNNSYIKNNSDLAEINVKMGLYYLIENKDVVKSKEKLIKATVQAPDDPMVWYSLAYFDESTGDLDAAKQHYKYALKVAPNDSASQNNYATFLCRIGDHQAAINYFLRAAANPNYLNTGKAYENAASCAMKIPDITLAKKYYRLAEQRNPELSKP